MVKEMASVGWTIEVGKCLTYGRLSSMAYSDFALLIYSLLSTAIDDKLAGVIHVSILNL